MRAPAGGVVHCPTHPEHFYDVHRLEFEHRPSRWRRPDRVHVLSLVEGQTVLLETAGGEASASTTPKRSWCRPRPSATGW